MKNLMQELNPEISCKRCGLVNDFRVAEKGIHQTAICNGCDSYIQHLKQTSGLTLYFGKYKGRELSSMVAPEELNYIQWALRTLDWLKPAQKTAFSNHLKQFNLVA